MLLVSGVSIASAFHKGPSPSCSVWKQFRKQEMLILCPENMDTAVRPSARSRWGDSLCYQGLWSARTKSWLLASSFVSPVADCWAVPSSDTSVHVPPSGRERGSTVGARQPRALSCLRHPGQ